jgi:ferredoxin-thioredoxin reductase catalytic subunit
LICDSYFSFSLVQALNKTKKKLGIPTCPKPVGFNLETSYQCKTIAQLREDRELGIYVINARLADMSAVNAWWYPVCHCDHIIDSYLGAFLCDKCHAADFEPLLK